MDGVFEFSYKWSRPATVPFPNIWHKFEVKSRTGKSYKIRVEDLTPDRYDEAWSIYSRNYFDDEPIAKSLRMSEDENSMALLEQNYRAVMNQNASLIAVLDEPEAYPKIISVHVRAVISKDEPTEPIPETINSPFEKYNYICLNFLKGIDVFREFDCERYIDDYGLCVTREFRGQNIAKNMLIANHKYGIAFKIRGELVVMANPAMHPTAKKLGFRIFRKVELNEMKDKNGQPLMPGCVNTVILGGCKYY